MPERVRQIVHLSVPDFPATLEERRDAALKRRPLALAEPGPRAVIQGVNSIARSEGICEGMPLSRAKRLSGRLIIVAPDHSFYRKEHERIVEDLGAYSPFVEGSTPGRYFVDLTGTRKLWGAYIDTAVRMEKRIAEKDSLHAGIGLAANRLVSRVASDSIRPGDVGRIFPGGEAPFLSPLPVSFLPGIGLKTASRLLDFNVERVGELASISIAALSGVFGNKASRLHKLSEGIDNTPVLPLHKIPSLRFTRLLDRDAIDRKILSNLLFKIAEDAGWELRSHNRHPRVVTLEIRYADGVSVKGSRALAPVIPEIDRRLYDAVFAVFSSLFKRRVAVRRIAVEFSDFFMPIRQLSLFPWDETAYRADKQLQTALDRIRDRFGRRTIQWGRGL